jgi:ferredoxin
VSKPLRIRLDRTLCDGFGICAKHAPEYFSLDDWGYASLIGDGTVPESDRDAVMRALMDCPVHAIIAMGEHQLSGRARPSTNPEEPTEPHVENPNSEAISEFVR